MPASPGAFSLSKLASFMNDLKVGIIGFGRIGAEHAAWIERAPGVAVSLVADATEPRRALAQSRDLRTCQSIDQLLSEDALEAVLVSLPTSMHFECASKALNACKHVMIEKPIALDLHESRQLVDLARKQNRVLGVFHNRRWDIDFLTVQEAISSGRFGRVINVESRLGQWASCVGPAAREWRPNWRNEASFGGGGLYDWGSHFVDQIWRLMLATCSAKPVRVFAQLRANVWSTDCDDFARMSIAFDNGAVGLVEINTTTTRPLPRWHIDGTAGSAESPHSPSFDLRTWAQLSFTSAGEMSSSQVLPVASDRDVLTEPEIWRQFAAACRGDAPSPIPAQSVLPTMALLDAARQSSQTGCSVDVSTAVEWRL